MGDKFTASMAGNGIFVWNNKINKSGSGANIEVLTKKMEGMNMKKLFMTFLLCVSLILPLNGICLANSPINNYLDAYTFYKYYNVVIGNIDANLQVMAPSKVSENVAQNSRSWFCRGYGNYSILLDTDLDNIITRVGWISGNQLELGKIYVGACIVLQMDAENEILPQSVSEDSSHIAFAQAVSNLGNYYYFYSPHLNKNIYIGVSSLPSGPYAGYYSALLKTT